MEQKEFSIFKSNGKIKLQIGTDIFVLDEIEQRNILNCLNAVNGSRVLFPNSLNGTAIMYPNGIVAVNLSIGKIDLQGSKYIVMVYSLKPKSSVYDVNMFMCTGDMVREYINVLENK